MRGSLNRGHVDADLRLGVRGGAVPCGRPPRCTASHTGHDTGAACEPHSRQWRTPVAGPRVAVQQTRQRLLGRLRHPGRVEQQRPSPVVSLLHCSSSSSRPPALKLSIGHRRLLSIGRGAGGQVASAAFSSSQQKERPLRRSSLPPSATHQGHLRLSPPPPLHPLASFPLSTSDCCSASCVLTLPCVLPVLNSLVPQLPSLPCPARALLFGAAAEVGCVRDEVPHCPSTSAAVFVAAARRPRRSDHPRACRGVLVQGSGR